MNKFSVPFTASLLLTGVVCMAQTDSTTLPEINISGNRIQSTQNASGRAINVVLKTDMETLSGQTPNDWLATVSGVDIRQRGPVGVQADLGIRGGSFDQSLVLMNGLKLSDPQTGHHMMNLPFTNEAIQQIEVIKGSASRMYGINALTGSVNFVTKVPDQNMIYGGILGGQFGLFGIQAGAAMHNGKLGQHISFSRTASDGYSSNTDFKINNIFYQATYKANKGTLNITGGYTSRDFGASGFYSPNSNEYETTKTGFGGIQYDLKLNHWKIKTQMYYRYNEDEYIYNREKPSVYHNHHYTHALGAEVHANYSSFLGQTGFGIDTRLETLASNNLGDQQREIAGAFAEHRFSLFKSRLTVTPGLYLNTYTGNHTAMFPGIDATYRLYKQWYVFASADKGMRLPTFTDLYYVGPNNIGNPNLSAEEAVNTELGLKYNTASFSLFVSAFNRQSSNLIDWAREDATQKWQPQNLNNVVFNGVESALSKSFNHMVQKFTVSYTFIDAQFNQPDTYTSRYTLSNIKHQAIGVLQLNWFGNLYQSVTMRYINRVTMADYTLIDSKLWYTFKQFNLYMDVSNILNTNYMEAGYVTMPGTWAKVGLDFKLKY